MTFWSSDKLTGSQTNPEANAYVFRFWSSDKLTGSQTQDGGYWKSGAFWSSDKLTGSQTKLVAHATSPRFGAVTN